MIILSKSEAEALEQFLNGERLWSWPNGRMQLGQTFPDIAVVNRLVAEGLLDKNYEPTEAGRSALESWLAAGSFPDCGLLPADKPMRGTPSR